MDHKVEYLGRLERLSGHPPGDVPVDFRFDTVAHPASNRRGDSQTLGMVSTGAYGNEHTGFLLLSVSIWGNAAFEATFMRALASGEDELHVWLWADRRTPEIPPTTSGLAPIRPLTRIKFDRFVRLSARR